MTRAPEIDNIHNELSPILTRVEVLVGLCLDIELGRSPAAKKVDVLITLIEAQVSDLRQRLDDLCHVVLPAEGEL